MISEICGPEHEVVGMSFITGTALLLLLLLLLLLSSQSYIIVQVAMVVILSCSIVFRWHRSFNASIGLDEASCPGR